MNTRSFTLLSLGALLLGSTLVLLKSQEAKLRYALASGSQPFIVKIERRLDSQRQGAGAAPVANLITRARTSSGDFVEGNREMNPLVSSTRNIIFSDGVTQKINESEKIKTTMFYSKDRVLAEQYDPGQRCLKTFGGASALQMEYEAEETLKGLRTLRIVSQDAGRKWIAWRAPELNCVVVQQHVIFYKAGTNQVETATEDNLLSVERSEPEALLFETAALQEVPANDFHYRQAAAVLTAKGLSIDAERDAKLHRSFDGLAESYRKFNPTGQTRQALGQTK